MALYFKDRIPDPINGENARYYDAVAPDGSVRLPNFRMELKNSIPPDRQGDPLSAGNLNYASGNAVFPAGSPSDTRKGTVMAASAGAVVPAFTRRGIAAQGVTAQFNGCHRMADDMLLVMYGDRITPVTFNFAGRTVALGADLPGNAGWDRTNSLLVRELGGGHAAQLCVFNIRPPGDGGGSNMVMHEVTATAAAMIWGPNVPTMTSATNIVRVGGSSLLFCGATAHYLSGAPEGVYAYLMTCGDGTLTLANSAPVPGLNAANLQHTLFCYDPAGGKYILIYVSGSNVYARPINVTGSDISFGSPQLLGTTTDTLYSATYNSGGDDYRSDCRGELILDGYTAAYATAKAQLMRVNSSGLVTKGPVQTLPVMQAMNMPSHVTSPGRSVMTRTSDGTLYMTGVDMEVTPRDACLLEFAIDGTDLTWRKYRPFQAFGWASDPLASIRLKQAAYGNPNSPGEFLFMQQGDANLLFWYGGKADDAKPACVTGVAIEEPSDGYVRVQYSEKLLPGLFDGLIPGQAYAAGYNGALALWSPGDATTPVGTAINERDLLFFGATAL